MPDQKGKKNFRQKFLAFLNVYYPETHLMKALYSLIFQEQMEGYYTIQNQEALGNYFCLKMISKLAPQKTFQKSIQILEAWKPTKGMKFGLEFFSHALLHMNST